MLKLSLSSGGDHKLEGNNTNYSLPPAFLVHKIANIFCSIQTLRLM